MNPEELHQALRSTIRSNTMDSARSQQTKERLIGISDLGACRNYLRHLIIGSEMRTPPDVEDDDLNLAAFMGAAFGERLEQALGPDFQTQVPITCTLPSGRSVKGTADILHRRGIADAKSKNGIRMVKRDGPSLANQIQVSAYLVGALQQGLIEDPSDPYAMLFYADRSGEDNETHTAIIWLDEAEALLRTADERLDDVTYAVRHEEEAPLDEPDQWCRVACTMYDHCRGALTDVEGLIDSPRYLKAVDALLVGKEMEKEGVGLAKEAKRALKGISGSTGTHLVRWITVNDSRVEGGAYERLDVRPLRKDGP